ncbi:3-methyl-2-oxobutanoate hydroxymethyltransferase [Pelagirhabdus alkalitolerans]|uniref:3-methyl-2-oxobutanoate hydroxymethyltransferase n=1 Tax=Pelagirhabdus alkalitolerans TaxID=1612202 RepID=UPI000B889650|nr:3-methyl-2-oxobutanoate hydroxymethyltransferase [Pelagirhabdus alkalitolerans]
MKTTLDFLNMKETRDKITMITAYDYPSAKQVEQAGADMILVGDSLGMVVLGYDSTIKVTIDDMLHHAKAASRGAPDTFIVVDMPFMSYHISTEETLSNARLLYQASGAQALKLEGATDKTLQAIKALTDAGIPVVAHIGLTPQSVNVLGGFKVQGKDVESAKRLIKDATRLEEAGAIAVVLEGIPKRLSEEITQTIHIPTIGIGAGIHCDGQVLVYHDIIQYGADTFPKFVKNYASVDQPIKEGLKQFVSEVKSSQFPTDTHSYHSEQLEAYFEHKGEME